MEQKNSSNQSQDDTDYMMEMSTVMKNIYAACNPEGNDAVKVSHLIDFIRPYLVEDLSALECLRSALDPRNEDIYVSSTKFYEVMNEWAKKISSSDDEDLFNTTPSQLDHIDEKDLPYNQSTPRASFGQKLLNCSMGLLNISNVSSYSFSGSNRTVNADATIHEEKIKKLEFDLHKCRNEILVFKDQLAHSEEQNEIMQANLQKSNKKIQADLSVIEILKKENQDLEEVRYDLTNAKKQIEISQKKIGTMEKDNDKLVQNIEKIEQQKEKIERKYEELNRREIDTKKEIYDLKMELGMKEEEIAYLVGLNNEFKEKLNEQKDLIDYYTNETEQLSHQKVTLEKALKDKRVQRNSASSSSFSVFQSSDSIGTPESNQTYKHIGFVTGQSPGSKPPQNSENQSKRELFKNALAHKASRNTLLDNSLESLNVPVLSPLRPIQSELPNPPINCGSPFQPIQSTSPNPPVKLGSPLLPVLSALPSPPVQCLVTVSNKVVRTNSISKSRCSLDAAGDGSVDNGIGDMSRKTMDTSKSEFDSLQAEMSQAINNELQHVLEEKEETMERLQQELEKHIECSETLAKYEKIIHDLTTEKDTIANNLRDIASDKELLQSKLEEAEKGALILQVKLQEVIIEKNVAVDALETLEKDKKELVTELEEYEELNVKFSDLQVKLQEVFDKKNHATNAMDKLEKEKKELITNLEILESDKKQLVNELIDYKDYRIKLEEEKKDKKCLIKQLETLKNELKECEKLRIKLSVEIEYLKTEKEKNDKLIKENLSEKDKLISDLNSLNEKLALMEDNLANKVREIQELDLNTKQRIIELENLLANKDKEINDFKKSTNLEDSFKMILQDKLQTEVYEKSVKIDEHQQKILKLTEENIKLENLLREQKQNLDQAANFSELNKKISDTANQVQLHLHQKQTVTDELAEFNKILQINYEECAKELHEKLNEIDRLREVLRNETCNKKGLWETIQQLKEEVKTQMNLKSHLEDVHYIEYQKLEQENINLKKELDVEQQKIVGLTKKHEEESKKIEVSELNSELKEKMEPREAIVKKLEESIEKHAITNKSEFNEVKVNLEDNIDNLKLKLNEELKKLNEVSELKMFFEDKCKDKESIIQNQEALLKTLERKVEEEQLRNISVRKLELELKEKEKKIILLESNKLRNSESLLNNRKNFERELNEKKNDIEKLRELHNTVNTELENIIQKIVGFHKDHRNLSGTKIEQTVKLIDGLLNLREEEVRENEKVKSSNENLKIKLFSAEKRKSELQFEIDKLKKSQETSPTKPVVESEPRRSKSFGKQELKISKLENKVEKLERDLKLEKTLKEEHIKDLKRKKYEFEEILREKEKLNEDNQKKTFQMATMTEKNKEIKMKFSEVEEKLKNVTKDLNKRDLVIKSLKGETEVYKQKCADLDSSMTVSELRTTLSEKFETILSKDNEIIALSEKIKELESFSEEINDLRLKNSKLDTELTTIYQKHALMKQHFDDNVEKFLAQIKYLEKELDLSKDDLVSRENEYFQNLKEHEETIERLKQELEDVTQNSEEYQKYLKNWDKIKGTESLVKSTELELTGMNSQVGMAKKKLETFTQQLESRTGMIIDARKELGILISKIFPFVQQHTCENVEDPDKNIFDEIDEVNSEEYKKFSGNVDVEMDKLKKQIRLVALILDSVVINHFSHLELVEADGNELNTSVDLCSQNLNKFTLCPPRLVVSKPDSPDSPSVTTTREKTFVPRKSLLKVSNSRQESPDSDGKKQSHCDISFLSCDSFDTAHEGSMANNDLAEDVFEEGFPHISDTFLEDLGLSKNTNEALCLLDRSAAAHVCCSQAMSREETEHKFTTLAVRIALDSKDYHERSDGQKNRCAANRQRLFDLLRKVAAGLRAHKCCVATDSLQLESAQLEEITSAVEEMARLAGQYGMLSYEGRMMKCWNLVMNYMAILRQEVQEMPCQPSTRDTPSQVSVGTECNLRYRTRRPSVENQSLTSLMDISNIQPVQRSDSLYRRPPQYRKACNII